MRRSKVVPQLLMILGLIPCRAGAGTESQDLIRAGRVCEKGDRAPDFGPAANNLAMATLQLGRIGEARRHLAQADDLGFKIHPQLRQEIDGGS